jgi:hypothetical protein
MFIQNFVKSVHEFKSWNETGRTVIWYAKLFSKWNYIKNVLELDPIAKAITMQKIKILRKASKLIKSAWPGQSMSDIGEDDNDENEVHW